MATGCRFAPWSNHFNSPDGLWYCLGTVRRLALVLALMAACGGGARMTEPPTSGLQTELLDDRVVEGGTVAGLVRIRASLRRGEVEGWSKTYVGKSTRWGRTHSPENFNEALSNALADVAQPLVRDDDFAHALAGAPAAPSPAPDAGPPGA